ncbi:DUF456 domain-containing protein [Zunongwangia sp. F363]|uniref:DUF456 domain-containing protein n=1 Tax=Autumnicola tepida TaxID=3075595 RepID=A0ABU3CC07_9FLAO|nr:DUF456 domain-containing protein [Zunongwangia sp. F363]MDT0643861.1 DUF456 domain-containing protein [Zunongwangia sp. F363]
MDIIFFSIAAFFMLLGILGSILPVLPGVPLSWAGLLLFYLAPSVPVNYWFLGISLAFAILVYVLQLIIPAIGTKRFGGTKAGMIGATIGLIAGIFTPAPFAILIGPFVGAFIGEMINKTDSKSALKAAFGSFIGFLASSFMEFMVSLVFLTLFLFKCWDYRELIF